MVGKSSVSYFRNFIFGVEDSLVSTVGLLSGVAIAGLSRESLLATGVVLICVEAISMAAGSFLSESSAENMEERSDTLTRLPYVSALVMFLSYFISGFIPLAPYLVFGVETAFSISIVISLAALIALGVLSGSFSRTSISRSAVRMVVVGGIAIAVGATVGRMFNI